MRPCVCPCCSTAPALCRQALRAASAIAVNVAELNQFLEHDLREPIRFGIGIHGGEVIVDLMLLPQHVDDVTTHLPALRRRLPPGTVISIGVLYLSGRETGAHLFRSRGELEERPIQVGRTRGEEPSGESTARRPPGFR